MSLASPLEMGHRLEKCQGNCYWKLEKWGLFVIIVRVEKEVSCGNLEDGKCNKFLDLDRDFQAKVRMSAGFSWLYEL